MSFLVLKRRKNPQHIVMDADIVPRKVAVKAIYKSDFYSDAAAEAERLNMGLRRSNPGMLRRRRNPSRTTKKTKSKVRVPIRKDGGLDGWKKSHSQKKRLAAIERAIKKEGYAAVIRRMNAIAIVNTDYKTVERMRSDMLKTKKKHRPGDYKKNKAAFEKKTKEMLKKKKKSAPRKKSVGKKKTKKKKAKKRPKKNPTRKKKVGPKVVKGTGPVRINAPKSAMANKTKLAEHIYAKTGWPMSHCRIQAKKILGK
jgi:hypothetical protein